MARSWNTYIVVRISRDANENSANSSSKSRRCCLTMGCSTATPIFAELVALRNLIGNMDTLIAVTALARDLTLVTSDRHFQRVPGLTVKLIDWQALRQ